jgi:hypothetical protein
MQAIDEARFPDGPTLQHELATAGFANVRILRSEQRWERTREHVLAQLRGRHISTFELMSDDEVERGIERAERELAETIETEQHWLVAVAQR